MLKGFRIQASFTSNKVPYEDPKDILDCCILASNDIKQERSPEQKCKRYQEQSKVAKGFCCLKAPIVLASHICVQKPQRVEATLRIMILFLWVYASLKDKPQKKKRKCSSIETKKKSKIPPESGFLSYLEEYIGAM